MAKQLKDVDNIKTQYYARLAELRNEYKKALKTLLIETGRDKDVRAEKSKYLSSGTAGRIGRLLVVDDIYNSLGGEIRFYPYTKAGALSKKSDGLCWKITDFTPIGEDDDCKRAD